MFMGILYMIPPTRYLLGGDMSLFTVRNLSSADFNDPKMKGKNLTSAEKEKYNIRYKQFHMMFWFILNTITLSIFVIISNTSDVNFEVFGSEHSWRSLPIISNIILVNSITVFTLCCGVFSLILFYLQVTLIQENISLDILITNTNTDINTCTLSSYSGIVCNLQVDYEVT